jgi:hypothetical protein
MIGAKKQRPQCHLHDQRIRVPLGCVLNVMAPWMSAVAMLVVDASSRGRS